MVWINLATREGREVKRKWLGMGITLGFDSMQAMTAAWNLGDRRITLPICLHQ